jgi:hypothetical protein
MSYVCESFELINGLQTCVEWTEFNFLSSLAITKSQMIEIGGSLLSVAGIFLAFAIIAKAVKLL